MLPVAAGLLLLAACETTPKQSAAAEPAVPSDDAEPAMAPMRREPCGEEPSMMLPSDPPRQTGVVTFDGKPIE
jgi:hypothetical protein